MFSFQEFLLERESCSIISPSQIKELEKFADKLLDKFDIDIEFSKHFQERMSDSRNEPCIKVTELQQLFKKISQDQGKKIKAAAGENQAVLVDLQKDLNLPFVIEVEDDGTIELKMKTIMRKKDFKTPNARVVYEAQNFEIGDWVYHETSESETWAYILEPQLNGGFKAIAFTSDNGYMSGNAVQVSTKNWYPAPVKIDKSDVPAKALKKIESKIK